ncbi:MAG TPA: hypothetical protein VJ939_09975, partial [Bacteroidales bacterium]|nr:hypothetical protein [Bacteroidales bacterium]
MDKNKKYISFLAILTILLLSSVLKGQTLSDADSLLNQKQYADAISILQNLKSQNPDDASIQQKLDNAREQQ